MEIFDTHCHLYLPEFENDIETVIKNAENIGVSRFYMPSINSTHYEDMLKLQQKYPTKIFLMIGLHPCYVKENNQTELDWIEQNISNKIVAIGEIGLDFYWDTQFKKQQIEIFETQMELALKHNLPIVIHCRNAMQETIDLVKPFANKGLKGIFHCFGGDEKNAKDIRNLDFLMGIGGIVTYKNAQHLIPLIKNIGLSSFVLETDAPYLAPITYRGKRNESSYLHEIIQYLALNLEINIERIAEITSNNAKKLFHKNI